jgi:TRAP-type C4-dicarboxylate transport system substrate-binding protein
MHFIKDEVERRSKGQLIIDILGWQDVCPPQDQVHAVGEGIIDMVFTAGTDAASTVPVCYAMILTGGLEAPATPWEEREKGVWDLYREFFAKYSNTYWLGASLAPQWSRMGGNIRVERYAQANGLKIRASASNFPGLENTNMIPVLLQTADVYPGMERHLIDLIHYPPNSWIPMGFHELVKYVIGPRFFQGNTGVDLINLDLWNSLSKEEQSWLTQPYLDYEKLFYARNYFSYTAEGEELLRAAGIEFIEWPAEDNEAFIKAFQEGIWKKALKEMDPDDAQRFAKVCGLPYPYP